MAWDPLQALGPVQAFVLNRAEAPEAPRRVRAGWWFPSRPPREPGRVEPDGGRDEYRAGELLVLEEKEIVSLAGGSRKRDPRKLRSATIAKPSP